MRDSEYRLGDVLKYKIESTDTHDFRAMVLANSEPGVHLVMVLRPIASWKGVEWGRRGYVHEITSRGMEVDSGWS